MTRLDSVRLQIYYTYRALFTGLNWPGYISNYLIRPAMQVALFYAVGHFAVGDRGATAFGLGMIAYNCPFIMMIDLMPSFVRERNSGTLTYLFVSRVSRWQNYLARPVLHVPNGMVAGVVGVATLVLASGLPGTVNWLAVAASILVVTASTAMLSLLLGSLAIRIQNWTIVYSAATSLILVATGVVIPVAVLPAPVRWVGEVLPVTHGLQALRLAFAGGSARQVLPGLGLELLVAVGYAVLGIAVLRLLETLARRSGSLELLDV